MTHIWRTGEKAIADSPARQMRGDNTMQQSLIIITMTNIKKEKKEKKKNNN